LSVAARTAGAAPATPSTGHRTTLPSAQDPLLGGAVAVLGGPPGRRARLGEHHRLSPLRWLVLLALLTSVLGFWQKAPCRVHGWTDEYQYTRACYTDVLALYYSERLDAGAAPYLDHPVEYPVVIGGAMALAAVAADDLARLLPGGGVAAAERELASARAAGPGEPQRVTAAEAALSAAHVTARARSFYDLTWLLLTVCAVVVVVTTARLAGRRRLWDAALVAVAPGLLLHATTNWDLVAVALAGLGLLAWARRRPVLAGVLLGLATATKLYPVLFLIPLLALCWRVGRLRTGLVVALWLAATAAAVSLPVYLASPSFAEIDGRQVVVAASPAHRFADEGLAALAPHTAAVSAGRAVDGVNGVYRFVELNAQRPADWDSLHYLLQRTRGQATGPLGWVADTAATSLLGGPGAGVGRLNASVAVGTLLAMALVVLLALRAPRRPRLPQLLFLAVVGFLLANKVWSPQYVLWLLPLAALARPRWRPFLAWQAAEAGLLFARFYFFISLPLGDGDKASEGVDVAWFLSAVAVRDLALLAVAASVVRDVLRPGVDVVRAGGADDPAGGLLDGASDRGRPFVQPPAAGVEPAALTV